MAMLLCIAAQTAAAQSAGAICGNGVIEGAEECDDGGTCIGGSNAGTHCSSEADCIGSGVCIGGAKFETVCDSDTDCPDGECRHCVPFGGDGCSANCTSEMPLPITLVSGVGNPYGSFAIVHTELFGDIPLPLIGAETATVGKMANGEIPLIIKADSVSFPPIDVGGLACACIRAVVPKTCGGTVFEVDGSMSTDCTAEYTAGDSICDGAKPCTFVYGDGNSALGVIGCNGLPDVNLTWTQDALGSRRPADCASLPAVGAPHCAAPPVVTLSGAGGPGSAVVFNTRAIGIVLTTCSMACTEADPIASRGTPMTQPLVTGSATAEMFNINGQDGKNLGPFSVSGFPFSCSALDAGAALATAFTEPNAPTVGDEVVTEVFQLNGGAPTPSATATPPVPACVGDCNGDGLVRVNEIITGVNIALGNAPIDACPALNCCGDICLSEVSCIVQAVNNALIGCTRSATPTPTTTP